MPTTTFVMALSMQKAAAQNAKERTQDEEPAERGLTYYVMSPGHLGNLDSDGSS